VPYGPGRDETVDIFRARGASRGVLVFIHGGYWRALDKRDFSFVAPSLCAAGITVAIPNYSLCPRVSVADIVGQMVAACAWLGRNAGHFGAPPGRIYLAGHSAGGQLTAMMMTRHWPQHWADLPERPVRGGLSISGVFDLADIVRTPSINADVRLTPEAAREVSPCLLKPATDALLHLAIGSDETEGFWIQHRLMLSAWRPVIGEAIECAGRNHFSVLDELASPDGSLFQLASRMFDH
jgi:arylformamidase